MFLAGRSMEFLNSYEFKDRKKTYTMEQTHLRHGWDCSDPRMELPRPALHTSLSEASVMQRRQESNHMSDAAAPDPRSQQQTLPGLRDILSPDSSTSARSPYSVSWRSSIGSAAPENSTADNYASNIKVHPPMVLQPPPARSQRQYTQHFKAFDVPVLATSPVARGMPQSQPVSPYTRPREVRDYTQARVEQSDQGSSVNAYPASNLLTSHIQSPSDPSHHQQRRLVSSGEPSVRSAGLLLSSADSQQKYIGVREVPGQGMFHVFEDGHRLPTHVDGETVNPQWGLTKANKPRKRLALACLDCREKKIKCEPGVHSCLQCEKTKRTCRRPPPQSIHTDSPSHGSWPSVASSPRRKVASTSDPTPAVDMAVDLEPQTKRRTRDTSSPTNNAAKKHQPETTIKPTMTPAKAEDTGAAANKMTSSAYPILRSTTAPSTGENYPRHLSFEEDPYDIDPEATMYLLNIYFANVNNATYCMFPRKHFLHFVQTRTDKCVNERMVLYSMLALASVFAGKEFSGFGKQCAQIAGDTVGSQVGRLSICLAVSRVLLSIYHFAKGSAGAAWDYCGSALHAITFLRLQTEEGCLDAPWSRQPIRREFFFSFDQLAECKRRTFWAGFVLERYSGGTMCTIKPQDIYVRLPVSDEIFESDNMASEAPLFNNDLVSPDTSLLTPASPLAPIAWLALVSAIWGDVMDFLNRAPHRAPTAYPSAYESFYNETANRLQGWSTRLPSHMQYSEANLDLSIQNGYAGTFVAMHTLHHFIHMKLNRHLRHSLLPDVVPRNIAVAQSHARRLLQIVEHLRAARRQIERPSEGQLPTFTLATPFVGHMAFEAVDVAVAGGPESMIQRTHDQIKYTLDLLCELKNFWHSASEQYKPCETKLQEVEKLTSWPYRSSTASWQGGFWRISVPLWYEFGKENDCLYGLRSKDDFFAALGRMQEDERLHHASCGLRLT